MRAVNDALDGVPLVVEDEDDGPRPLLLDHRPDLLDRQPEAAVADEQQRAAARSVRVQPALPLLRGRDFLEGELGAEGGGDGPADGAVVGLGDEAAFLCQFSLCIRREGRRWNSPHVAHRERHVAQPERARPRVRNHHVAGPQERRHARPHPVVRDLLRRPLPVHVGRVRGVLRAVLQARQLRDAGLRLPVAWERLNEFGEKRLEVSVGVIFPLYLDVEGVDDDAVGGGDGAREGAGVGVAGEIAEEEDEVGFLEGFVCAGSGELAVHGADVKWVGLVDDGLAHVGCVDGEFELLNEGARFGDGIVALREGVDEDGRVGGGRERRDDGGDGGVLGGGVYRVGDIEGCVQEGCWDVFVGEIQGEEDVHWPRLDEAFSDDTLEGC